MSIRILNRAVNLGTACWKNVKIVNGNVDDMTYYEYKEMIYVLQSVTCCLLFGNRTDIWWMSYHLRYPSEDKEYLYLRHVMRA